MDRGTSCHIFIKQENFVILHQKVIPGSIANSEKSKFKGVDIGVAEMNNDKFVLLAPAYLSYQDDVNTISLVAMK